MNPEDTLVGEGWHFEEELLESSAMHRMLMEDNFERQYAFMPVSCQVVPESVVSGGPVRVVWRFEFAGPVDDTKRKAS